MMQLNLLPDVKLEYIKAQRQRRIIFTISGVSVLVGVVLLGALLAVSGLQKSHLSGLDEDIGDARSKLEGKPNISTILTVQNQLNSLTALHDTKPATSRLFSTLNSVTPAEVNIGDLKVDFTAQTVIVSGSTKALSDVNKYVDTLKFTTYKVVTGDKQTDANAQPAAAFSDVVMSSFSLDSEVKEGDPAKYSITFNYDPALFDLTKNVKLAVPKGTTTRSVLNDSTDLFQAIEKDEAN